MSKGLTLLELLIVVIIVAILAGVSFPIFNRAMEGNRNRVAQSQLELMAEGEQMAKLLIGDYVTCNTTAECNNELHLNLPTGGDWNYRANAQGCLEMFADRNDPSGIYHRTWKLVYGESTGNINITCTGDAYCAYGKVQ